MFIIIKLYGIICMYMDKFVVLFFFKIFIVFVFIMNWIFIYIKLFIYWLFVVLFMYQILGLVVKCIGCLVFVKIVICKYIFLFFGIFYFEEKVKNMILSFIYSSYKIFVFLILFLGFVGVVNFYLKFLQVLRL